MRILHVIALIPAIGCVAPPDPSLDIESSELTQHACIACRFSNGGLVGGHSAAWLRLDGEPNDDGVKFLEFRKDNIPYKLDIDGNILRYWGSDHRWHGYKELEGAVIRVQVRKKRYELVIDSVKNCDSRFASKMEKAQCVDPGIPFWTAVPSGEAETYRFRWRDQLEPTHEGETCPGIDLDGTTGGRGFEAVVFEGEYYDPVTRAITETDTTRFRAPFNIACIGSLPAKLALARRTTATSDPTYTSTISDDRQALARAWAAQYCGMTSFTETGHRIQMRDRRGWLETATLGWSDEEAVSEPSFKYEAVWDENGAVCLDTPRLAVKELNIGLKHVTSLKITKECGDIPKCAEQAWFPENWMEHGQLLTATVDPD